MSKINRKHKNALAKDVFIQCIYISRDNSLSSFCYKWSYNSESTSRQDIRTMVMNNAGKAFYTSGIERWLTDKQINVLKLPYGRFSHAFWFGYRHRSPYRPGWTLCEICASLGEMIDHPSLDTLLTESIRLAERGGRRDNWATAQLTQPSNGALFLERFRDRKLWSRRIDPYLR